jgi:hypothetical protein
MTPLFVTIMQWWENIKFEISSIMLPTTQLQHERSITPNLWFTTKPSKVKFTPNVNVINVKLTNIRLTLGVNFYVDVS